MVCSNNPVPCKCRRVFWAFAAIWWVPSTTDCLGLVPHMQAEVLKRVCSLHCSDPRPGANLNTLLTHVPQTISLTRLGTACFPCAQASRRRNMRASDVFEHAEAHAAKVAKALLTLVCDVTSSLTPVPKRTMSLAALMLAFSSRMYYVTSCPDPARTSLCLTGFQRCQMHFP